MPNMPVKIKPGKEKEIIRDIERNFNVSFEQSAKIIKDFHSEMARGLKGLKSSLKMIPAYVDKPTGKEKGEFISVDLGGTNLRILRLGLKGQGKIARLGERKVVLEKKYTGGTGRQLFDFLAKNIKNFLREEKIDLRKEAELGFTFSFPVKQTGVASGILLHWTKDFSAKDVVDSDVVYLLNSSLKKQGLDNVKIGVLVNDTVGTLVTQSYKDPDCDVALILGTGTNACYREENSEISKWIAPQTKTKHSIVNIEWGNFNKLKTTVYDRLLDKQSENPGYQILEKMVSGMYLGEISRLVIMDLINRKILFGGKRPALLETKKIFQSEYMSLIENDRSEDLFVTERLLKKIGVLNSNKKDRTLVKKICQLVASRAAHISAATLAAVIVKTDPALSFRHVVAVDGSVYEKYPGFSANMHSALKKIFKQRSSRVKMVLTKDGSGTGAAILAGGL